MAKKPMTMKAVEKTAADRKSDKGRKEGSAKDKAADRKMMGKAKGK